MEQWILIVEQNTKRGRVLLSKSTVPGRFSMDALIGFLSGTGTQIWQPKWSPSNSTDSSPKEVPA